MTRNHATVEPSDASICQLTAVARVGGVRAYRMRRDLGISTIRQIAECPIDELQDVWSIGPNQSIVIKGSAQGWMNKHRQMVKDAMPDSIDELDSKHRVAVVADDRLGRADLGKDYRGILDWFRKERGTDPKALIDSALNMAGIDVHDDPIEIGYVEGTDLCGSTVQEWYDRKLASGPLFPKQKLPNFWDKYATVCDDDRANDVRPITPSDVPISDVVRQDDIHWGHAAQERNQKLLDWADEVVIVMDGPYAENIRQMTDVDDGKYPDVECFTAFEPGSWSSNPDFDVFTPERSQTVANTYRDQESDDQDPVVTDHFEDGPGDADGNDTDVSFPEYGKSWGQDPEFDEVDPASERSAFRLKANDTDEGRQTEESKADIKQDNPGGKGQGKKKGGTTFLNG